MVCELRITSSSDPISTPVSPAINAIPEKGYDEKKKRMISQKNKYWSKELISNKLNEKCV